MKKTSPTRKRERITITTKKKLMRMVEITQIRVRMRERNTIKKSVRRQKTETRR